MAAAASRPGARRATRLLEPLVLTACLAATAACEAAPPATPAAVERAAPRHPIQAPGTDWARPPPIAVPARSREADAARGITPGPNSRVTPTPDMAPRVEPTRRLDAPSSVGDDVDRRHVLPPPREPGPPVGTIDQRPGTLRTTPGTIEIPQ